MKLILKRIAPEDVKDGEYTLMCARRHLTLYPDHPLAIFQQPCRLYAEVDGVWEEVVISV